MSDLFVRGIAVGVSALVTGVGCGGAPPASTPTPTSSSPSSSSTPGAAASSSSSSSAPVSEKQAKFESDTLARLRALQVFTAPELIQGQPAETFSCYGPCSRLGRLADLAEQVAAMPASAAGANVCEKSTIDSNIAALNALKVVRVDGLAPGSKEETCARADKLAKIVAEAKHRLHE